MALTSELDLTLTATLTSALDLATGSAPFGLARRIQLASGTAAGQADRCFADTRTLAASGTESLDLAGSLTDAYGATITFAKLKLVLVVAAAGNTNDVQVTRPASNGVPLFIAAGDGIALKPGGIFLWAAGQADAAGFTVTAGTGDLLTITNSAGTTGVDYSIIVLGTSA